MLEAVGLHSGLTNQPPLPLPLPPRPGGGAAGVWHRCGAQRGHEAGCAQRVGRRERSHPCHHPGGVEGRCTSVPSCPCPLLALSHFVLPPALFAQLNCPHSIDTAAAAAAATCNTRVMPAAQETGQTAAVDSGKYYARAAEHRELHRGSESRGVRHEPLPPPPWQNKEQGAQLAFNFASARFLQVDSLHIGCHSLLYSAPHTPAGRRGGQTSSQCSTLNTTHMLTSLTRRLGRQRALAPEQQLAALLPAAQGLMATLQQLWAPDAACMQQNRQFSAATARPDSAAAAAAAACRQQARWYSRRAAKRTAAPHPDAIPANTVERFSEDEDEEIGVLQLPEDLSELEAINPQLRRVVEMHRAMQQ